MSEKKSKKQSSVMTDDFDPAIALYADQTDENEVINRDIPIMKKGESITSLVLHIIGILGGLSALVTGLYYGTTNIYAMGTGGWGIAGVIALAVFGLAVTASCILSLLYHHKLIENKEHSRSKLINTILAYVAFGSVYGLFGTIAMRPSIIKQINMSIYNTNIFTGIGYLIMGIGLLLCILGILANILIKDERKVKNINTLLLVISFWPLVCCYFILHSKFSIGSSAVNLIIAAPIAMDIAAVFYAQSKSKYMHTMWHCFGYSALVMEAVAIIYYGVALGIEIVQ